MSVSEYLIGYGINIMGECGTSGHEGGVYVSPFTLSLDVLMTPTLITTGSAMLETR